MKVLKVFIEFGQPESKFLTYSKAALQADWMDDNPVIKDLKLDLDFYLNSFILFLGQGS